MRSDEALGAERQKFSRRDAPIQLLESERASAELSLTTRRLTPRQRFFPAAHGRRRLVSMIRPAATLA
jgi:hypothetical protein